MSNLTIVVDDKLIKRARTRAIAQGTSVSAKVREFLQGYVNEPEDGLAKLREESTARLMKAIEAATALTQPEAPQPGPRRTLREALYAGDFRARDRPSGPAIQATKATKSAKSTTASRGR